jgi:phosphonate transport system substrate-binding protein
MTSSFPAGMSFRSFLNLFVLLLGLLASAGLPAAEKAPIRLVFGVVPQQAASKLAASWTPVLEFLSAKTGYQLQFETAKDIPTFEKRLAAGEYDFAYMSPYTYTVVNRSAAGYWAFAKERDRKLTGIIVVRQDSPIKKLEELSGQELAFPAEPAIGASVIPRAYLAKQNIPFTPKYVGSHDSVYLSVAKGIFLAGGGVRRTLEGMPKEVQDQLRVLWTTEQYTPHPIAAHKRVPRKVVERLKAAMLAMDQDMEGKKLLDGIAFNGLTTAQDKDYDDMRALGITVSDHLLK